MDDKCINCSKTFEARADGRGYKRYSLFKKLQPLDITIQAAVEFCFQKKLAPCTCKGKPIEFLCSECIRFLRSSYNSKTSTTSFAVETTQGSYFGSKHQLTPVKTPQTLKRQKVSTPPKRTPKVFLCSEINDPDEKMDLNKVLSKLNEFAPPKLSASWDNVGLLTEPSPPHFVETLFITNDLTLPVLNEAIEKHANMILSYHPPIFTPMKKLCQQSWKEEIIVKCLENRIAVYSPHTSYDCIPGGVNDWLLSVFDCSEIKPIDQYEQECKHTHKVTITGQKSDICSLKETVDCRMKEKVIGKVLYNELIAADDGKSQLNISCNRDDVCVLYQFLQKSSLTAEVFKLEKKPKIGYGQGRYGKLNNSISLTAAVALIKVHLKLPHVRLATLADKDECLIDSVAVCAGSGSSVLRNSPAKLYVTGEMSHHDVLHAIHCGSSVILCEHSNTERGFLFVLRDKLQKLLCGKVKVINSELDCDPLTVV